MDVNSHRRFRESWSRDKQRGPIGRKLYDAADTLGVSRKFHDLWFPQRVTVRRVAHHLDLILPGWRNEIDHCYFGHTHLPFTNHTHERVLFHNTGSAIRDMVFQPLAFDAIELFWLPGSLNWVLWGCSALLALKCLTGFIRIRGRI